MSESIVDTTAPNMGVVLEAKSLLENLGYIVFSRSEVELMLKNNQFCLEDELNNLKTLNHQKTDDETISKSNTKEGVVL